MTWTQKQIAIDGPIKSIDGYGHMTENMIMAFDQLGYDVRCGLHWWQSELTHVYPRVQELAHRGIAKCAVGVRNSQPDSFTILNADFKIGYSMFEFTKIPQSWVPGCNSIPLNLVPSTWCKEIWLAGGVTQPVEVNWLGVNTDIYTAVERPAKDTFTFIISGTLSERKAPWLAWQAFQAAFPKRDDVRLIVKTPSWLPLVLGSGDGTDTPRHVPKDPRITLYNELWTKEQMVASLHAADCFVYPTRSEGFGLSPAEAMSTGLPVICTGESSPKDFMLPEHSYPLQVDGWEVVPSHWGDIGSFGCPSLDHLVELMTYVVDHRDEAMAKGRKGAEWVRNNLTWRHNAERLIAAVNKYI